MSKPFTVPPPQPVSLRAHAVLSLACAQYDGTEPRCHCASSFWAVNQLQSKETMNHLSLVVCHSHVQQWCKTATEMPVSSTKAAQLIELKSKSKLRFKKVWGALQVMVAVVGLQHIGMITVILQLPCGGRGCVCVRRSVTVDCRCDGC